MKINRYPKTSNRSLKAWNAADELIIAELKSRENSPARLSVYNDTFGYLTLHAASERTTIHITSASGRKAIDANIENNELIGKVALKLIDEKEDKKSSIAVIKIPKSMDLFHLMIVHCHKNLEIDGEVICGFMTRHFTTKMLDLCGKYFDYVHQSKAVKKARIITLKNSKTVDYPNLIHTIEYTAPWNNEQYEFKQYYGVFSAKHIDYATQYLVENLILPKKIDNLLDLASGNGVIAKIISKMTLVENIHMMDDSVLAVASAKMNISGQNVHHYINNSLAIFEDAFFDFIVCNPPFHFGHENTIEISLDLFRDVSRCLKENGQFIIVANRHLNYSSHLSRIFNSVEIINESEKFEIIKCTLTNTTVFY